MEKKLKYREIRDLLLKDIRNGIYERGAQLPPERSFAATFGVSHMTVRRAMNEMEEDGVIIRKEREGAFLNPNFHETNDRRIVNIICPFVQSSVVSKFIEAIGRNLEKEGNIPRFHWASISNSRSIIKAITGTGQCIVLSDGYIFQDKEFVDILAKHNTDIVVIGQDLSALGIASVKNEDYASISHAMQIFKDNGHEDIAVLSDSVHANMKQILLSSYFNQPNEKLKKHFIDLDTQPYESSAPLAYDAVRKYLQTGHIDVTGFFCWSDDLLLGAMAACRDEGLRIPEDMSFLAAIDTPATMFSNPPVTTVGPDIEKHVEKSLEILRLKKWGELAIIPYKVVSAKSVARR